MGKKPSTKCKKECTEHRLIFKPLHYWAYLSKEVHQSFCQPKSVKPRGKKTKTMSKCCFPVFNKDKKFYTPSFSLPEDQVSRHFTLESFSNQWAGLFHWTSSESSIQFEQQVGNCKNSFINSMRPGPRVEMTTVQCAKSVLPTTLRYFLHWRSILN